MRKLVLSLLVTLPFLCFAQNDSSFIDLGRTQLRKDFVQGVKIKGTDLEKMPFSNLDDAIKSWLFSFNTNPDHLVYVIDGQLSADINFYSIHDIEEIQLVQNAQVQLNGSYIDQQLIHITTRKARTNGSHIESNAKIHMVENGLVNPYLGESFESERNLFHQYRVAAYHRNAKFNSGASVNFLHDVWPVLKNQNSITRMPDHINRFGFNSYADVYLSDHHTLSAKINITKQQGGFELTMPPIVSPGPNSSENRYNNDLGLNAEIKVLSRLSKNITNQLSAGYTGMDYDFNRHYSYNIVTAHNERTFSEVHADNILTQNTSRVYLNKGRWEISPSLNLQFRHTRYNGFYQHEVYDGQNQVIFSQYFSNNRKNQFMTTPTVDISLPGIFNLNGGVLLNFSNNRSHVPFPFVSASFDILKAVNPQSNHSIKLFGSYAKTSYFNDQVYPFTYKLMDISSYYPFNYNATALSTGRDSAFNDIQAGIVTKWFNEKMELSYNFDRRSFVNYLIRPYPFVPNGYIASYPTFKYSVHRIQLGMKPWDNEKFMWHSQLHLNSIVSDVSGYLPTGSYSNITGDLGKENRSIAAGWNNRFRAGRFGFGFDVAAHFNKIINPGSTSPRKEDLYALEHAFLSYGFSAWKFRNSEFFISTRNLFHNDWHAYRVEPRQLYGVGFRLGVNRQS